MRDETRELIQAWMTISNTYTALLGLQSVRHLIQPELCDLRDWLSVYERRDPEVVQDDYENR